MNKIVTALQMKNCDSYAINNLNIPSLSLMERAASAFKEEFLKFYKGGKIAVICGGGNNGGDGAAAARLLYCQNIICDVYLFNDTLSCDCKKNIEALKDFNIKLFHNPQNIDFTGYDYIIDALFGTGLNRKVTGIYFEVIKNINISNAFVISVDIPSGLNSDSGKEMGICVNADVTVTFAAYKYGQLINGLNYCGEIILKNIDIPVNCGDNVYGKEDIKKFFPKRLKDTHKGSYGKLAIFAGSGKYFGAALIVYNAAAALKSGAGLTTLIVPKFLADSYRNHIIESTLLYLPDNGENALYDEKIINQIMSDYDAVCIGMGMGTNEETYKICKALINNYDKKLIIDADALNSIAQFDRKIFKKEHKCDIIITPHIKEFSRLTDYSIQKIKNNIIAIAKEYAKENNITLLLKGASTIIADKENLVINVTGSPAMAKAGSGDVLSGIIGGLAAQGHNALNSGIAGAYIHGKAGEFAAETLGEYSPVASDICNNIYKAISPSNIGCDTGVIRNL